MFFISNKTIKYGVDAVKRLHSPTMYNSDCFDEYCCEPYEICSYCDETYPCLTIELLEGTK
jgi:hypothetical protein